MTIDDDNSIYVGGLPYDASEADLRRAFSLYGSVVAVKIINDREVGGKCYGFVTFTNPRSAVDAISDMNGRTIGGRVVRVNDVRPRGTRPSFQRENFHGDAGRDVDWDKERDREREYVRDRERYKDRNIERFRDHDRERERDNDRVHDFDRTRDQAINRSRERDDQGRAHDRDRDWERDHESDFDQDRDVDEDHNASRDEGYQSKTKLRSHSDDHQSRELSSDFSEKHNDQVKEELEISIHRRDELQGELDHLEDKIEEKEKLVSDLQKKSQKLEEAVAATKKLSSQRQSLLAKMHKSFLQVRDYTEKLKTSEQELQVPPKLHFVVVPLLAQGHMIPMADLALLLASRGARVSLITTPVNARRLRAAADHANSSGLSLLLIELPFPSKAAGLPDGCENVDLIPSTDLYAPFFRSLNLMAEPLKNYLRGQPPSQTCIISDQSMPWTMEVSRDLGIPRLLFHGPSCFFLLCTLKLAKHKLYEKVTDVQETFTVPELPQRIEVNKLTAQRFFDWPGMEDIMRHVQEAEDASDGLVLNTFYELEPSFIDEYRRSVAKEVWVVGPVSLFHKDAGGKAVRGNGSAGVDHGSVFQWLEGREKGSVLFISFGSMARTRMRQLVEIGFGLEASGRDFVWAMKEAEENEEQKTWLAEFEKRNRMKGLIIKGWVPQVLILTHPAVGGFMTHCGWNSTLEAVAAGVPMVTWPHFSDQFLNEKLVVEVLRTGVAVGVKFPSFYQEWVEEEPVGREKVAMAVRRVMCGGLEAEEIRKSAWELGEKARKAMEEGGSSYINVSNLINHAVLLAENRVPGMK